jgi:CHAT domain-containing protein
LPFDAFLDDTGRYVAETHTVVCAPSASSFYLLTTEGREGSRHRPLLAVGGVPYGSEEMKQANLTRGYDVNGLSDLPASKDEVLAADATLHNAANRILLGPAATESAFKRAHLVEYGLVHLAVHGLANRTDPDRAALFLLSDPAAGEDGILHASEIAQLRLSADAVILSACDTAVGPIEGQEGIATLSRAFLLAGARTVISTLWSIDDTFSLFLMRQFYKHLANQASPADALAAAKRDMLRRYGEKAVPYYWAAFTFEGAADQAMIRHNERERSSHVTKRASAY